MSVVLKLSTVAGLYAAEKHNLLQVPMKNILGAKLINTALLAGLELTVALLAV